MTSKQEKRIALVVIILLLGYIIVSAFCSCRSRKYLQSKVGMSETLVEKSESSTHTNFFDSIRQWLSVDADSITLTFTTPGQGPGNPTLPEETKSSPILMGDDLSLGSISPDKSGNNIKPLVNPFHGMGGQHLPTLKAVTIHRPHITASSEERAVAQSSSTDSNNKSEQSVIEEDIEQESVPNYPLRWLYCIAIAAIAISIFSVLNSRR